MFVAFLLDLLEFVLKAGVILVFFVVLIFAIGGVVNKSKKTKDTPPQGHLFLVDLRKEAKERSKLMVKGLKKINPDVSLKKKAVAAGLCEKDDSFVNLNKEQNDSSKVEATGQEASQEQTIVATDSSKAPEPNPTEAKVSTQEQSEAKSTTQDTKEAKDNKSAPKKGIKKFLFKKSKTPSKKEQLEKDKKRLLAKKDQREEALKQLNERSAKGEFCPKNLFVIDFEGSTKAKEIKLLRRQIDAILEVATDQDEVIVNLCSPGGVVNTYGLCSSQLQRIRERNIFLTVTVDEVAASGGYLMACVANKIVAAPFSYIGSIGVIAGVPNFRKVLNKYDVDYEQITAGKYKRTLSMLGENTQEGREKFKEELEAIHEHFKGVVKTFRPNLDLDKVATGEHWLALDALKLGLVDEIATSDEYIQKRINDTYNCAVKIIWKKKENKNLLQRYLPKVSLFSSPVAKAQEEIDKLEQNSFLNIK